MPSSVTHIAFPPGSDMKRMGGFEPCTVLYKDNINVQDLLIMEKKSITFSNTLSSHPINDLSRNIYDPII